MYGAQPVTREEAPQLYRIMEFLCSRGGIPMPKIYIIPYDSPNAFATGRNPQHASVAVTEGALRLLNEDELTGVLAHEISHVKNRDILISSVAATLAGIIMWVANMARFAAFFGGGRDREEGGGALGGLVTIIVAPIAAMLIQMWISRTREYQADASGADMAGNPHGLASALQKLENYSKRFPWRRLPARRTCLSCIRSQAAHDESFQHPPAHSSPTFERAFAWRAVTGFYCGQRESDPTRPA